MQDAEERRLRRINNTPQREVIDGNEADDTLLVDQGSDLLLTDNKELHILQLSLGILFKSTSQTQKPNQTIIVPVER